ncbi:hypothetical protein AAHA92_31230 [Salvia divinorum]|uniref:Uncharacterized protein n=1 Tax=Salvia divinorum TaxID=28513 RepID=A0ABD1FWR6_SALDI
MAEKRRVPWVPFWTASSCSLSSQVYTDQIVRAIESTETAKQEKALSFIPGLEMATTADLLPEIFLGNNASPLVITINKMVEHLPKSTAVVLNSFKEIDPIITKDLKSKFPNFLNVGPSILLPATMTTKQDASHGWEDHAMKSLPNGFIDRTNSFGRMVAWAPQQQILAHESVGVFINHCGWNLILESITSCVPLICRPFL